ncbi:MAG: hypothetical protein HRT94_09150 [Alphaproteobacteria bacterium]|nr:hypothetical protein [Alphaproteobacteria bacterium]
MASPAHTDTTHGDSGDYIAEVGHATPGADHGIMYMLSHDTSLWVAFSFILFVVVAFKLGRKSVVNGLDGKINEIKSEIDNAERLRVEAQELLAQYQRKQQDAEKEAKDIVKNAKSQAKSIKKNMQIELEDIMARRESQLADRMKRLEENAIAKIQNEAADVAMAATTEMIMQTLDEKTQKNLMDDSIKVVSKQLN